MANRKKRWEREAAILEKEQRIKKLLSHQKNKIKHQEEERKLLITYLEGWFSNKSKFSNEMNCILRKKYKIKYLKFIHDLYNRSQRKANRRLLISILKHPKLLYCSHDFIVSIIEVLQKINAYRDLETWKAPKSLNEETLYKSLFMHLFVRYPLAKCVEREISLVCTSSAYNLMIELVKGKGVHQLEFYKFSINGKGNFYFNNAPQSFSFAEALWWGKIKSMNVTDKLAYCIIGQAKPNLHIGWQKWVEDYIFFVKKCEITNIDLLKEIFNFVLYQNEFRIYKVKFKEERFVVVPPLYESYSLKGRTKASVEVHLKAWQKHIQLYKEKGRSAPFPTSPFKTYGDTLGGIRLVLKRITNFRELAEEGREMKHCVYDMYSNACAEGRSFIFSLKRSTGQKVMKRLATVEIRKKGDQFVVGQFYAKANNLPPDYAVEIVKKWAKKENIDSTSIDY